MQVINIPKSKLLIVFFFYNKKNYFILCFLLLYPITHLTSQSNSTLCTILSSYLKYHLRSEMWLQFIGFHTEM